MPMVIRGSDACYFFHPGNFSDFGTQVVYPCRIGYQQRHVALEHFFLGAYVE